MQLTELVIEGFAGVAQEVRLKLDAQVVILSGQNGLGKTSICDAIFWGLSGAHPRGASPQNLYSRSPARVEISGLTNDGVPWTVTRILRESSTQTTFTEGATRVAGAAAARHVANLLFPTLEADELDAADGLLSDGSYMQQETLRAFLTARSDDERFSSLATMVGARRLSAFVDDFDAERRRWAKQLKADEAALESLRRAVGVMQAEVAEQEGYVAQLKSQRPLDWSQWVSDLETLLGQDLSLQTPSEDSIEEGLAALSRYESQCAATLSSADVLIEELTESRAPATDLSETVASLERVLQLAEEGAANAREELAQAHKDLDRAQQVARAQQAQRAQLIQLAGLARDLLHDHCPVCEQPIDEEAVRARLNGLIHSVPDHTPELLSTLLERVANGREDVAQRDLEVRSAQEHLDAARSDARAEAIRTQTQQLLLQQLRLEGSATPIEDLHALRSRTEAGLDQAQQLRAISLEFRRLADLRGLEARLESSQSQLRDELQDVQSREQDLRDASNTAKLADATAKSLKQASDDLVARRLADIKPTLDHLYAAIDPHPTFTSVRLATRVFYGKERLDPVVKDERFGVEAQDPGKTLSTSQANALAVAIFLAFSLGLSPSELNTIVLDDPLQNLDDVHVLGLVDVLRQVRGRRQLIITTHDAAFARLLARKLRPVTPNDSLLIHAIQGWDRSGPSIRTERRTTEGVPFILANPA